MSKGNNGKLSREGLELDWKCDVCERDKAHGNHQRCSRVRQERYRLLRETESIQRGTKQ